MRYCISRASSQHSIRYITPHRYPSIIPICFIPLYAKHSPFSHSQCKRPCEDARNRNLLKTELGRIISRPSNMKLLSSSKVSIFFPYNPKAFLTLLISIGARDWMAALLVYLLFRYLIPGKRGRTTSHHEKATLYPINLLSLSSRFYLIHSPGLSNMDRGCF